MTITTASSAPSTSASIEDLYCCWVKSTVVKTCLSVMLGASWPILASSCCTRCNVATSEAPLALNTAKVVAGRPFKREMLRTSSTPSRTSAISLKRATRPSGMVRRTLTELRRAVRAAEHPDRLFRATHLGPTARGIDIHQPQLLIDLAGRDAVRLHACRIEIDPDLTAHAAGPRDLRHAGDRQKPLADRVVNEPGQLLLTHAGCADGEVHDRPTVHVQALHLRLENSLRQIGAHARYGIAYVGRGPVHRGPNLKFDHDLCGPFRRRGSDVFHVADVGDRALDLLQYLGLELRRRRAGLTDGDLYERSGDVRIERDGQTDERHDAKHAQHREQHEWEDRMRNGPGRDVLHGQLALPAMATVSPMRRKAPAIATTRSLPSRPWLTSRPSDRAPPTVTARRSTLLSPPTTKT